MGEMIKCHLWGSIAEMGKLLEDYLHILCQRLTQGYGIRSQLLPLIGRTRYGYTYTQNSSPIYWGVKLTNHVELLILMSDWLDCCLSFQEMLN